MDIDNNFLFNDNGEQLFVPRLINTKALPECSFDKEDLRLLGRGRTRNSMFILLSLGLTIFLLQDGWRLSSNVYSS